MADAPVVDVVWLSYQDIADPRGYWDQGIVEDLFSDWLWKPNAGHQYRHRIGFKGERMDGAVVVLPGQFHRLDIPKLNSDLSDLRWVILIVTSDEASLFPWRQVVHPNMSVWVQMPRDRSDDFIPLPIGYPPNTLVERVPVEPVPTKTQDWFFCGQMTHSRRSGCVEQLEKLDGGTLVTTDGFNAQSKGLPRDEYLKQMVAAKIAPCPAGMTTPDSFRVFEALQCGTIPIVDVRAGELEDYPLGYWEKALDGGAPFPQIDDWETLPRVIDELLADWPFNANVIGSWWLWYKRRLTYQFNRELYRVRGETPKPSGPDELITVLMPTSVIPSHPDTSMIAETIRSVRKQLPNAEIILMIDGVRQEQSDRKADYDEYVRRLIWKCNHEWTNVLPIVSINHQHQANITRMALGHVKTPAVLFVEHDTPLVGEIDWDGLCDVVGSGDMNVIRLSHESNHLFDLYRDKMLDDGPVMYGNVPLVRTSQWSQRPHLAATAFYETIIDTYFGPESRTMIEDVMHGVVDYAYREQGEVGWSRYKVAVYAPDGDIKRSDNLDGRKSDPKFDMKFAYRGDTPEGAPAPTDGRVD